MNYFVKNLANSQNNTDKPADKIKLSLRPSIHGILLFCLTLFLLLQRSATGQVWKILWVGLLLLLFIYFSSFILLQSIILITYYNSRSRYSIIRPPLWSEGQRNEVYVNIYLPYILPGLRIYWIWPQLNIRRKKQLEIIRLGAGLNKLVVKNIAHSRGEHQVAYLNLQLQDTLSFFKINFQTTAKYKYCVAPGLEKLSNLNLQAIRAGLYDRNNSASIISTNFHEQREYIPGDDPRHINWKLYAHHEKLFVRIPEKSQPRNKPEICCLLNPDFSLAPARLRPYLVDIIARKFMFLISELLTQNNDLSCLLPNEQILKIDPQNKTNIMVALARLKSSSLDINNYKYSNGAHILLSSPAIKIQEWKELIPELSVLIDEGGQKTKPQVRFQNFIFQKPLNIVPRHYIIHKIYKYRLHKTFASMRED